MSKKQKASLTQRELIEKVLDIDVSDEEIAEYFVESQDTTEAFHPQIVPNPDLIVDDGLEGAAILNTFNKLARIRRNRVYKRRIRGWGGVKIVAEGDSWFQYPLILKDVIDQLCDLDNFKYAIYGLSEAGDLLSNIVREDEITEAIQRERPDVFLISGGGNDMVGNERMATMVHKYSANRKVENYPNEKFDVFLDEIESIYRQLFTRLLAMRRHLKIVCHGYDYALPDGGKWLGNPLEKQGIDDKKLQKDIVKVMIDRFNERLIAIANDFDGSVYHVDCRTVVKHWYDELHPRDSSYFAVAKCFDKVIKRALSDNLPATPISTVIDDTPKLGNVIGPRRVAKVSKLSEQEFTDILFNRARHVLKRDIEKPKTIAERKQIEKDFVNHLEKIHLENNLLPINFLEKGVERAQSVCRISTVGSYGSGFLIASRNFIMTNNHVLSSAQEAARSRAEFDYDEDSILYTVELKPERFFVTDAELDFTIVACDPDPLPQDIKAIELLRNPATITRGERANIIQHPSGGTKKVSIHDNKVTYVYDNAIQYRSDTKPGSSGSPVFNNEWDLVALHHAGWLDSDSSGAATNQGIRISKIVEFLMRGSNQENTGMLAELLANISAGSRTEGNGKDTKDDKYPKPSDASKCKFGNKKLTLNLSGDIDELTINFERGK